MALKKPTGTTAGLPASTVCTDPAWESRWPTLCSHLFDVKYEDGSSRQTSTLMLLAELGVAKACLNDREAERSAWVSARSVVEALDVLEAGLVSDSLDWRARQASRSNGKPRK